MSEILLMMLSIVLSTVLVWALIPILRKMKVGQSIREEGNKEHYKKAGTPTMGGIAFVSAFLIISLAFIYNLNVLFVVLGTLFFGLIGFIDDFEKIVKKHNLGLNEKQKLILQFGISFILILLMYVLLDTKMYMLKIPFITDGVNISVLVIPILIFIMVGTVNAVNLTDGLDGLLSSVSIPVYIGIYFLARVSHPNVAASALIFAGVLLGFLVFNSNPCSIMMGDTGSMAIGGSIVVMMFIINKPIYLIFIGGIYLIEALSVIIQVAYFKKTGGKRIFRMSPIHHHFELGGHKETKIVASFMVVSILLTLFTLYIA
ncbi:MULTISPECIES: phospho-N-acetylmuramoyl-pentapeptide-transferase [Helcococcus]|uniref:Phospho-N-acetylmuramoyl-pentapeptide-transferase n=1 Tax=Helcococcus bovis TaxID=3153252 RepID=A0ABW9F796_9FIRM